MATFADAFTSLRQQFDQGHQDRQQLLRNLQAEVKEHAALTASQLAQQSAERLADFSQMMGNLRGEVQVQAAQVRGWLGELQADLRQGGEVFRGRGKSRRSR